MSLADYISQIRRQRRRPVYRSIRQSMVASAVAQAALLISGILAARLLGVEQRGQLALFVLIPTILSVIGGLGIPVALTYFIAKTPLHARAAVATVGRFGMLQVACLLLLHSVILVSLYRSETSALTAAAAISILIIPTKLAQDYGNSILQGQQLFRAFNIVRCLPAVGYAALISGVFLAGEDSLLLVTACYVVATASAGCVTLIFAVRTLPSAELPQQRPPLSDVVAFGVKGLFGARYPTEAFQLDQAFVGAFLSQSALGAYVVGAAMTNFPRFVAQSVGMVAYPNVAQTIDLQHAWRKVWHVFWLVVATSFLICGTLAMASPILVPVFFGPEFHDSVPIAQLLLIGAFFLSIRRALSDAMRGAGYPLLGSVAELTSLVLLVPTLSVLVPLSGVTGAATAVPISAGGGLIVLLIGTAVTRRRYERRPNTLPSSNLPQSR